MNAYKHAQHLFTTAFREGLDAPTEGQVADAINDATGNAYLDCQIALKQGGFGQAAEYLERLVDRMHHGDRVLAQARR